MAARLVALLLAVCVPTSVPTDFRSVLKGLDDGSSVTPVGLDPAGAITQYGGRDVYYDWLGRPVLVLDAGGGDPVVAYAYDAFGRLARRTAPWPSDASKQRIEEYHYDGVRRIQEIFTDPVAATPPWPQAIQPGGPLGGGGSTGDTVRTEAEYVWSAASGQPFDTCHVQIDWWDREAWFVQDHQTGTVRAYTDPSGEVIEQYGFDAFGNLLRRDAFPLVQSGSLGYYHSFRQRLGHQGLFADRLDAHTAARVIEPGVEAWYQSRSRWYAPELGRFVTADPNGTGVPVQASLAMHGSMASGPPSGSFGWESHYGDGWDVFTAYGANPVVAQDSTGLYSDPFAEIDAIINEHQLSKQFGVGRAMDRAGLGWSQIKSYSAAGFAWQDLVWDHDTSILTSMLMGPFFSSICFTGDTIVQLKNGAKRICDVELGDRLEYGDLQDHNIELAIPRTEWVIIHASSPEGDASQRLARLLRPRAWAETFDLAVGSVLSTADPLGTTSEFVILSISDAVAPGDLSGPFVSGVYSSTAERLVWLRMEGVAEEVGVTPEHPFLVGEPGLRTAAADLAAGDILRGFAGNHRVEGIRTDNRRTEVHNLEVAGSHVYCVSSAGVLVHNGCTLPKNLKFGPRRGGGGRYADYAEAITGTQQGVYSRDVEFDGFFGNTLLEIKGYGYEELIHNGYIAPRIAEEFLAQARRQISNAQGYKVMWVFAEENAANLVRRFFSQFDDTRNIIVQLVPGM